MASAQLLEIADGIDSEVREIANNVIVVDDRVAGVDERVTGVGDRVKDVDDKVRAVDDKLVDVIDGARYIFNQLSKFVQLLTRLDGKEARGVIQQAADGVDRIERSCYRTAFMLDMQAQSSSQGVNYDRISVDGFPHQIHLRITISRVVPITRERRPGFSKEARIKNGSQQIPSRYSGFMENVRRSDAA